MSIINNVRMCPANAAAGTVTANVNGRPYSCAVGSAIDVSESDANALEARGFMRLGTSGQTVQRPAYPPNTNSDPRIFGPPFGYRYVDTTLGKVVIFNGSAWVDAVTGALV